MTIIRKVKPVSDTLPAARLYLDDISEIVRIFSDAFRTRDDEKHESPELKFTVAGSTCDEAAELPRIAKSARRFELQLTKPGYNAHLELRWSGTWWVCTGLTEDENWSVYRKLAAVYDARKLRLQAGFRALILNSPWWVPFALGILVVWGFQVLGEHLERIFSDKVTKGIAGSIVIFLIVSFVYLAAGGNEVIFRDSQDHAALREERAWKIIPVVLSGIIGFLVGVAVTYLKHAYWP